MSKRIKVFLNEEIHLEINKKNFFYREGTLELKLQAGTGHLRNAIEGYYE